MNRTQILQSSFPPTAWRWRDACSGVGGQAGGPSGAARGPCGRVQTALNRSPLPGQGGRKASQAYYSLTRRRRVREWTGLGGDAQPVRR